MRQTLFVIPLHDWLGLSFLPNVPVYGYGMMLFFAFLFCNLLARRLFRREGYDPDLVLDLLIWLFVAGIAGGRILYVTQYWYDRQFNEWFWDSITNNSIVRIIALWDGGLVFYGAIFGGALGYFAYYYRVLRKHGVSNWKMLDIVAPCIPMGLALGRIGCLFTGCCFGNVSCEHCPSLHFPLNNDITMPHKLSPPAAEMIRRGYQSPRGFTLQDDSLTVAAVDPGSPAAAAGLKPGDTIERLNRHPLDWQNDLDRTVNMQLAVKRNGATIDLPAFTLGSIGVHPTQVYESISMFLLLFFLLSYYPYKRRDGELMVLLMFGYGVHRYLNEMLRTDTDQYPPLNLTLSQYISILVLASGVALAAVVWQHGKKGMVRAALG